MVVGRNKKQVPRLSLGAVTYETPWTADTQGSSELGHPGTVCRHRGTQGPKLWPWEPLTSLQCLLGHFLFLNSRVSTKSIPCQCLSPDAFLSFVHGQVYPFSGGTSSRAKDLIRLSQMASPW